MKSHLSHLSLSTVASVLASFAMLTGSASASAPTLPWSESPVATPNQSYLVQTNYRDKTLNDEIFMDSDRAHAMRIEQESHFDADEARENAGLYQASDERSRFQVMKDYARRAMNSVTHFRMRKEGEKLKDAFLNTGIPKEPVAAAILVGTLYTGRSLRFHLFGDTRVDSHISLRDKNGSVSMPFASTGLVGTFAYDHSGGACASDLSCASLSKEVAPNISAILNSASRGTAQVVYSVSF
jgi:hypothetical protein